MARVQIFDLRNDTRPMRAAPIHLSAAAAAQKARLRLENVRRHLLTDLGFASALQNDVALGAARECRARGEPERAKHLAELLVYLFRFDQEMSDAAPPRQFDIPRQQNAILRPRDAREFVIVRIRQKSRIVPQQSQPRGESPQHIVREESHRPDYTAGGAPRQACAQKQIFAKVPRLSRNAPSVIIARTEGRMPLTRTQVQHIAELAKLKLSDEELDRMTPQLSAILDHAARLQELDTDAIPPTASVVPLQNVMREDQVAPSLPRDDVLANAPDKDERSEFFRVRAILKDEG